MPPPIRIVTYQRLDELWEDALRGWLAELAARGLPEPGRPPPVVLAPDETRLGWLKRSWLEAGGSGLFGVRFWTPGLLRRHLLASCSPSRPLATAEDLVLAARLELAEEAPDSPLGVVAEQPDGFLAAWDAWLAARGAPILFAAPWQRLPGRLGRRLRALGLISVREVDSELATRPPPIPPVLGPLLIDGFSSRQAALYPFLRAALRCSESALVTTPWPRERRLEEVWLASFEAATGAETELAEGGVEAGPFAAWVDRAQAGEALAERPAGVDFRLFQTRQDEVNALVARVAALFRAAPEGRLGVVLPAEPLLTRLVASGLLAEGVPLHDSFGYFPVAGQQERLFAAWVEYQRTGRLIEANAFLEALVDAGRVSAGEAETVRAAWAWGRERCLAEEVALLTALLADDPARPTTAAAAVEWARSWFRLPERAGLRLFLDLCAPSLAAWGGDLELERHRAAWAGTWERSAVPVGRTLFLDWLWGSLRRPGRARGEGARDAFAPVQLVSYDMVRSAHWTHLLLAGLNERLVPPPPVEGAFLAPDAAARHLREHLVAGPQGEGQEVLREGAGFLLDEADRRSLLQGAVFDAIAETSERVELFATYAPEGEDRDATVLSALYQRLYRAAAGPGAALPEVETVPDDASSTTPAGAPPVSATAEAYARRFDPTTPFDAYSFALAEPPLEPLELGARQWEAALARPAAVWLEALARVRPREDFAAPVDLTLARGAAVHRLLRLGGNGKWVDLRAMEHEAATPPDRRARAWREAVERAHAPLGRPLSPLWLEQWGLARGLADELLDLLRRDPPLPWLASEQPLPDHARWTLAGGGQLPLRGRVDALLLDDPETPATALVIDFKTGSDRPLKPASLAQGKGLQLALYGGALADLYRCPVALCLLKPGDTGVEIQLSLRPGEDPSGLLPGLVAMSARGILGFVGELRSEFAYTGNYPLALVVPPAPVAEVKWALTHPLLPRAKGDEE
jgi:hypothetical protein